MICWCPSVCSVNTAKSEDIYSRVSVPLSVLYKSCCFVIFICINCIIQYRYSRQQVKNSEFSSSSCTFFITNNDVTSKSASMKKVAPAQWLKATTFIQIDNVSFKVGSSSSEHVLWVSVEALLFSLMLLFEWPCTYTTGVQLYIFNWHFKVWWYMMYTSQTRQQQQVFRLCMLGQACLYVTPPHSATVISISTELWTLLHLQYDYIYLASPSNYQWWRTRETIQFMYSITYLVTASVEVLIHIRYCILQC